MAEKTKLDLEIEANLKNFEKFKAQMNETNKIIKTALTSGKLLTNQFRLLSNAYKTVGAAISGYYIPQLKNVLKPLYDLSAASRTGQKAITELQDALKSFKGDKTLINLSQAAAGMSKYLTQSFSNLASSPEMKRGIVAMQANLQKAFSSDESINLMTAFIEPIKDWPDLQRQIFGELEKGNYKAAQEMADLAHIPLDVSAQVIATYKNESTNPWVQLYQSIQKTTSRFSAGIGKTLLDVLGDEKMQTSINKLLDTFTQRFKQFLDWISSNKDNFGAVFEKMANWGTKAVSVIASLLEMLNKMPDWAKTALIGTYVANKATGGLVGSAASGIASGLAGGLVGGVGAGAALGTAGVLATIAVAVDGMYMLIKNWPFSKNTGTHPGHSLADPWNMSGVMDKWFGPNDAGEQSRRGGQAQAELEEMLKRNQDLAASQAALEEQNKKNAEAAAEAKQKDFKTLMGGIEAYGRQSQILSEITEKLNLQAEAVKLTGKGQEDLNMQIQKELSFNSKLRKQGEEQLAEIVKRLKDQTLDSEERMRLELLQNETEKKLQKNITDQIKLKFDAIKQSTAANDAQLAVLESQEKVQRTMLSLYESTYGTPAASAQQMKGILDILEEEKQKAMERLAITQKQLDANKDDLEAKKMVAEAQDLVLQKTQQQLELSKKVRDGYLSAIQSQSNASGFFSKLIINKDLNAGLGLMSGAVKKNFLVGQVGNTGAGPESVRQGLGGFVTGSGNIFNSAQARSRQSALESGMNAGQRAIARAARQGVFDRSTQSIISNMAMGTAGAGGNADLNIARAAGLATSQNGRVSRAASGSTASTNMASSRGIDGTGRVLIKAITDFVNTVKEQQQDVYTGRTNTSFN